MRLTPTRDASPIPRRATNHAPPHRARAPGRRARQQLAARDQRSLAWPRQAQPEALSHRSSIRTRTFRAFSGRLTGTKLSDSTATLIFFGSPGTFPFRLLRGTGRLRRIGAGTATATTLWYTDPDHYGWYLLHKHSHRRLRPRDVHGNLKGNCTE